MNAEAEEWLTYAAENLEMARLALERGLFNPCLQNCQQAVEKGLKALLADQGTDIPRTHHIRELARLAKTVRIACDLSNEDCDLLDAIYIPSKYPVFGILPDQIADVETCQRCLSIATRILDNLPSR